MVDDRKHRSRRRAGPAGKPRRLRLAPEERSKQLREAAFRVFGRLGYEQCSVTDITTEAGSSPATFYVYFQSKADVAHALAAEMVERLTAGLAARAPYASLEALVESVLVVGGSVARDYGPVVDQIRSAARSGHEDFPPDVFDRIDAELARGLRDLTAAGELNPRHDIADIAAFFAEDVGEQLPRVSDESQHGFLMDWYCAALRGM